MNGSIVQGEIKDPLSDALSLLRPRTYHCGGLDLGTSSCIEFPRHSGMKCYAVVSGQAWLTVEGTTDVEHLKAGQCFLLPRGNSFRLAGAANLLDDQATIFPEESCGAITSFDGGGKCLLVGAHYAFAGEHAAFVLGVLQPIVHLAKTSDKIALRWSLKRLTEELRDPQPGGVLVAQYLANLILVQALRIHLSGKAKSGLGLLSALSDKRLSAAVACMHEEPARAWTVDELAQRAGMSRSAFAVKFKEIVGESPIVYLRRWRMMLAEERIASGSQSVSELAQAVGYESASAFTKAFKRITESLPREHSRRPSTLRRTLRGGSSRSI